MKIVDIRGMRSEDLSEKLLELGRHVFDLRAQAVTEKLENTNAIRSVRKEIARIKTILRERQLKGGS
ncbi:MAG: 50S ribosomal protein L29 [Planctomycetes bacterium GWC2_49_10]|nr:MAG: 50S ribosomal protein L29 [Planctomycetes bacterium GWC2_49_10]